MPTALLGVDFLPGASGRYVFAKIYSGDNTREDYRSPLTEPGIDVHQGDYLLAVNGVELKSPADPYSLFVGIDEQPVTLTVASSPDGPRRTVTVKPITKELSVRERDWIDTNRAIEGGVCLLIAVLGNVMGKVRRNFYVGIRTPWTIANEQVWNATHRFAAKTMFAGGVLGLIAAILRAPFWLPIGLVMAGALVPAVYSLVFYKRLERRGELN